MLKLVLHWFFYGDKKIMIMVLVLMNSILFCGGYVTIRPYWEAMQNNSVTLQLLQYEIQKHQSFLKTQVKMQAQTNPTIMDLAAEFDVSMMTEGSAIYFAGSTPNIIALLKFMLDHAYPVQEFQVKINHYKTLLVVTL